MPAKSERGFFHVTSKGLSCTGVKSWEFSEANKRVIQVWGNVSCNYELVVLGDVFVKMWLFKYIYIMNEKSISKESLLGCFYFSNRIILAEKKKKPSQNSSQGAFFFSFLNPPPRHTYTYLSPCAGLIPRMLSLWLQCACTRDSGMFLLI